MSHTAPRKKRSHVVLAHMLSESPRRPGAGLSMLTLEFMAAFRRRAQTSSGPGAEDIRFYAPLPADYWPATLQ